MQTAPLELPPRGLPDARAVMRRASSENFPVAARVLTRAHRRRLRAIYGFARLADELGDEYRSSSSERLAALDWLACELERAYAGRARHPLLVELQRTLNECELPRAAFMRLIEANRLDQRVSRYEDWEQLQAYCELSANPVGELVLAAFELATPARIELSDRVCTALQLTEHLQDLGEDVRRGRFYLPERDLADFGCSSGQLSALMRRADNGLDLDGVPVARMSVSEGSSDTRDCLGEAIAFEISRARGLLAAGVPLVSGVSGAPKLALAGFVAGGRATLEAIERAGVDVLRGAPRAGRRELLRALLGLLAEGRR